MDAEHRYRVFRIGEESLAADIEISKTDTRQTRAFTSSGSNAIKVNWRLGSYDVAIFGAAEREDFTLSLDAQLLTTRITLNGLPWTVTHRARGWEFCDGEELIGTVRRPFPRLRTVVTVEASDTKQQLRWAGLALALAISIQRRRAGTG